MTKRIALALGLLFGALQPATANETTRMLKLLEEQQRIITEQHEALMALLRERDILVAGKKEAALPKASPIAFMPPPAPTEKPTAKPVQAVAKLEQGGVANGATTPEERGKWYASGTLRLVAPDRESVTGERVCAQDTKSAIFPFDPGRGECASPRDQTTGKVTANTDLGFGGTAALGRRVYDFLRVEGELGLTSIGINKIADYNGVTAATRDASGSITLVTAAANGIVDFDTGTWIKPYVGLGVGAFYADLSNIRVPTAKRPNSLNDSDFGFLGQALAGLSFELNKDWDFTLGCRYVVLPDVGGITSRNQQGDLTIDLHQIDLGVRRYF
jgi:opacity protein-like surface antigen